MPRAMPTILITGGAGFIGSSLAARLLSRRNCRVVAVDSLHPQVHSAIGRPVSLSRDVELIPGDVAHPPNWGSVLKLVQPDVIVHLAAETGTFQSLSEATRHATANVVGTTVMLDALFNARHKPAHIILTSSRAVYGDGLWISDRGTTFSPGVRRHDDLVAQRWDPRSPDGSPAHPLPSDASRTAASPTSVYGATKLAQEHILASWSAAQGVALSILRLQNVYGPGQSLSNPYTGIVSLFAQQARCQKSIDVYEDGAILRDFVYIEDVTDALEAALIRRPASLRTVDIGSGQATTVLSLASQLSTLCNGPSPTVSGRFRDGDVRAAACDVSAARDELGWTPSTDLQFGLSTLLDWIDAMSNQPDTLQCTDVVDAASTLRRQL